MSERGRLPEGMLEEIIEAGAYEQAYFANQIDPHGWQRSAMRQCAKEIEHALAEEEIG